MGWEGIDICNYHEYLFSDHIPIYCNIDGIRLIVSNNVSLKGARGINYNQEEFNPEINLEYLEEVSSNVLIPYFNLTLKNLIHSMIHTESGKSLLDRKVVDEFEKILLLDDVWESLRKLTTLHLY